MIKEQHNLTHISVLVVVTRQIDREFLVEGLAKTGSFERVVGVGSVSAAKRAAREGGSTVALIARDLVDESGGGVKLAQSLGAMTQPVRSLMIAKEWNERAVLEAFGHGAKGVFTESGADMALLAKALQCVHNGQVWANSEQLNQTLEYLAGAGIPWVPRGRSLASLSSRQREIAGLLANGASNREIADTLHISERTVKNHLASIFAKIGVKSRVQAVLRLTRGEGSRQAPAAD